jgi:hypothetical protein
LGLYWRRRWAWGGCRPTAGFRFRLRKLAKQGFQIGFKIRKTSGKGILFFLLVAPFPQATPAGVTQYGVGLVYSFKTLFRYWIIGI